MPRKLWSIPFSVKDKKTSLVEWCKNFNIVGYRGMRFSSRKVAQTYKNVAWIYKIQRSICLFITQLLATFHEVWTLDDTERVIELARVSPEAKWGNMAYELFRKTDDACKVATVYLILRHSRPWRQHSYRCWDRVLGHTSHCAPPTRSPKKK